MACVLSRDAQGLQIRLREGEELGESNVELITACCSRGSSMGNGKHCSKEFRSRAQSGLRQSLADAFVSLVKANESADAHVYPWLIKTSGYYGMRAINVLGIYVCNVLAFLRFLIN